MIVEAIVNARGITTSNQKDDANIIEPISQAVDSRRVVCDQVVKATHTKTQNCTSEEATKGKDIASRSGAISRSQGEIQRNTDTYESKRSDKVCIDIHSLIVKVS